MNRMPMAVLVYARFSVNAYFESKSIINLFIVVVTTQMED